MNLVALPGKGVAEAVVLTEKVVTDRRAGARSADDEDGSDDLFCEHVRMLRYVRGHHQPLSEQVVDEPARHEATKAVEPIFVLNRLDQAVEPNFVARITEIGQPP